MEGDMEVKQTNVHVNVAQLMESMSRAINDSKMAQAEMMKVFIEGIMKLASQDQKAVNKLRARHFKYVADKNDDLGYMEAMVRWEYLRNLQGEKPRGLKALFSSQPTKQERRADYIEADNYAVSKVSSARLNVDRTSMVLGEMADEAMTRLDKNTREMLTPIFMQLILSMSNGQPDYLKQMMSAISTNQSAE